MWQPAWGIRLILEALISFLPTPADGAIGALDWTSTERRRLALKSKDFTCTHCGKCSLLLPPLGSSSNSNSNNNNNTKTKTNKATNTRFAKEIEQLQKLQFETEGFKHQQQNDEVRTTENKNIDSTQQDDTEQVNTNQEIPNETNKTILQPKNMDPSLANKGEELLDPNATTTAMDDDVTPPSKTKGKPSAETDLLTPVQLEATMGREQQLRQHHHTHHRQDAADAAGGPPHGDNPHYAHGENHPPQNHAINPHAAHHDNQSFWLMEPLVHLMIVLMAILCYMLYQKFQALLQELEELQDMAD